MTSGQADLDDSTIAKRLRKRREIGQPGKVTFAIRNLTDNSDTDTSEIPTKDEEEPLAPPIPLKNRFFLPSLLQEDPTTEKNSSDTNKDLEHITGDSEIEQACQDTVRISPKTSENQHTPSRRKPSDVDSSSTSEEEHAEKPKHQSTMRTSIIPEENSKIVSEELEKTQFEPNEAAEFAKQAKEISLWWDT